MKIQLPTNILTKVMLLLLFVQMSCTKRRDIFPEYADLVIQITHKVDGEKLIMDSMMYINDAGNLYEVNRLEYYISDIVLFSAYGNDYCSDEVFYINGRVDNNDLRLLHVPSGKYVGMAFNIGLSSLKNSSNGLTNTQENVNMAWPEPMGGGYHFVKLEGYYWNGIGKSGYAIHIGTNPCLIECELGKEFLLGYSPHELQLEMNLNEWYRTPNQYNFLINGSITMGDSIAMQILANNGKDVFNVKSH